MLPVSNVSAIAFGCAIGFLWLATVPLTSGIVAQVFGARYLSTLYGMVFFSHQIGSFLGIFRHHLEETGIVDLKFEWGDRFFETGPYSKGKIARYYLAETAKEEIVMGLSPETGEPEHHEWRWVTFDEAYDLTTPRVRSVVQWARQIVGA